jgi:hypothetical protein
MADASRMTQADRREMAELLKCLTKQREHVLGILEGLDDDALRRYEEE